MIYLLIIVYIILYLVNYYGTRYFYKSAFGNDIWDWEEIIIFLIASLVPIIPFAIHLFLWLMEKDKIFKTKPPKWL